MRTFRHAIALAFLVTASWITSSVGFGQTPEKPVAVVSIAPLDRLMQDFTYLARSCGAATFAGVGKVMVEQYTEGLDRSRPLGIAVHWTDNQPVPIVFLPVADRKVFFTALARASLVPDDLGGGLFAFDAGGQTIFAKDTGKWMIVARQEADLKAAPADPAASLGELPTRYDIALRMNVQALPADLREMAISQMKSGFERSLAEQGNQSPEEKAAAEEMGKATIAQMERIFNETDQVLFAISAAPANQRLQLDVGAQFVAGSDLAKQMEQHKTLTSDFTGLLIQGAAMSLRSTGLISDPDKAVSKNNIRTMSRQIDSKLDDSGSLPTANKEAVKKFLASLVSVLEKTIDGGKLDVGGAISLNESKVRGVFGTLIADGMQVESAVKEFVGSMGNNPDMPKFEFNYAKHQNVNLHKVSVPLKTDNPIVQKVFGSELRFVIGTGAKALFLALDPDGDNVIKSSLDRVAGNMNKSVTPGEMVVEVGQVLGFASELSPNPILTDATQTVQQSEGKDHIRVLSTLEPASKPQGMIYQIMIEEGVLKGIGTAVLAGQGGQAGF